MLKDRRNAAQSVAEALFAAEKAIDTAIASTAALATLMPAQREAANLSVMIGQDALLSAIETLRALGQARQNIIETHQGLGKVQHDIGLSAVSFGGGGIKPAFLIGSLRAVPTTREVA
jgi:histidyl-tRNA synthetase